MGDDRDFRLGTRERSFSDMPQERFSRNQLPSVNCSSSSFSKKLVGGESNNRDSWLEKRAECLDGLQKLLAAGARSFFTHIAKRPRSLE